MNIKEKDKTYIVNTYDRADVVFKYGEGSILTDENGKEYIDFGCGIAVCGLGFNNKPWLSAVTKQATALPHISNLYYTEPCVLLAETLCKRTGFKKVFFGNSGAEANECAIKVARKYAVDKAKTEKPEIIVLKNSFHGRTMATLTATGQDNMHKPCFAPYVDGFKYALVNDYQDFITNVNKNTAAVMFELVQGEGGVNPLIKAYVSAVVKYCNDNDILVIVDEVQTGNGRTGTLYAYMQYGIMPDIVTTAKGLANGLPIGAVMFGEKTADVLRFGDHGSTFGANPIACAAALAVLEQIDDDLLKGVTEKHNIIYDALADCKQIKSISGLGLMIGIETDDANEKVKKCLEKGLVVLTAHGKIRLLPALNIDKTTLNNGLKILTEVLK